MRQTLLLLCLLSAPAWGQCKKWMTVRVAGQTLTYCAAWQTQVTPYEASFSGVTSLSVAASTHGQGTSVTGVCYDNATPRNAIALTAGYPTVAANGDAVFAWSGSKTGKCYVWSMLGVQGATGATGAAGAKGDKGDTGATGAAGAQGPAGPAGAAGAKGDKGDTGATGAQGPQGPQGPQGAAGAGGSYAGCTADGSNGITCTGAVTADSFVSSNTGPWNLTAKEGTAPSAPGTGIQTLYIDSADHHLKRKNSSNAVVDIEAAGGGGTIASTTAVLVGDGSGNASAIGVQNANKVFAGPTTGADAAPAFRALVSADIPAGAITPAKLSVVEKHFVITGSGTSGVLQDTDDQPAVWFNQSGGNMTITNVWCLTDSATATTIQLQKDDGNPADMLSSNLSCSTTKATTSTFVSGENVLADGNNLNFVVVGAGAGSPHWVAVHFTVTY